MRNAVIYARFSSDKQNAISIEAQERACREYALRKDLQVVEVYVDEAISGKSTTNRAAYQKMIRAAKNKKFEVILIHKYDRIARNLGDHINLQQKLDELGITLIAVAQDFGDGKEAKMMRGMQWIMSEYYIDNLAEETKKGHKEIALKGMHNGGVAPFGYDIVEQKYVINEKEAKYVRKMFDCALNYRGYTEVVEEMNREGIVGKRGKPFSYTTIYEILRNEKYTGVYIYNEKYEKDRRLRRTKPNAIRVEGAIPAIISKEDWLKVQKIMDSRSTSGTIKRKYHYSGIVYCGKCGTKMYGHTSKKKGHEYIYYICDEHCGQRTVTEEVLDTVVNKYINTLNKNEMREEFARVMNEYTKDEVRMRKDFEETRAEKLAEKQAELDSLLSNLTKGTLPEEAINLIGEKMAKVKAEIDKINRMKPITEYSLDPVAKWLDHVLSADDEESKRLVLEKIVVTDNRIELISTLAELLNFIEKAPSDEDHQKGQHGCGGSQPSSFRLKSLVEKIPDIYFHSFYKFGFN